MSNQQNPISFYQLGVTFAAIMVLGLFSILSLIKEPTQKKEAVAIVLGNDRKPASVSLIEGEALNLAKTMDAVFDCSRKFEMPLAAGTHIRFKGRNCDFDQNQEIKLINKTNGFSASIVVNEKSEFTSDFMELKSGTNEFQFSAVTKKGDKIDQSFNVIRGKAN
jgi:hypothetical protein